MSLARRGSALTDGPDTARMHFVAGAYLFWRRSPFWGPLHDRATSFSVPDTLMAGMPVASSLRRSSRCLRMETSRCGKAWV